MTITLEIKPETEAALRMRAEITGQEVEDFAAGLLDSAMHFPLSETPELTGQALLDASLSVRGLLTDEEVDTLFARNRSFSRTVDFG